MGNVPAIFSATDPALGDAFELAVRIPVGLPSSSIPFGTSRFDQYVSSSVIDVTIGDWTLPLPQQRLFRSRVEIGDNVSATAPPNDTLYYPADRFTISVANDSNIGAAECPLGLFANTNRSCYSTSIFTSGQDITGRSLNGTSLTDLDIGLFTPTTLSLVFADFDFNYRMLTFGNVVQTTQFASDVPEPATWAMMIGGFGMVGGAMRRRRISAKISFA
jgi:hypothetical protein